MKTLAIILTGCMLLLNSGYLIEKYHAQSHVSTSECCTDCSADCHDAEEHPQESDHSCHGDSPCTPGCACSCHIHLSALTYEFMELDGTVVQSYHYGNYVNTYTYEYSGEFLQPPRKA
jgi:hypothetical protein